MKNPGVIYRQYRQIRKLALLKSMSVARQQTHENCFYGKSIKCVDADGHEVKVRLCMLRNSDPDVCTNPGECNAFVRRWSDKEVIEMFNKIMSDPGAKKKLYPELWAYEWVLDKSLTEALKSPSFFTRPIVWAISVLEHILKIVSGNSNTILHGDKDAKA